MAAPPKSELGQLYPDQQNLIVAHQNEVVGSERITNFLAARMAERLPEINDLWMPHDYLPDKNRPDFREKEEKIASEAQSMSRESVIVAVLHAATEENLQAFTKALNTYESMRDVSGTDSHPWAWWDRYWAASEKRHGVVTTGWLEYSGRVNMSEYERIVAYLMRNGFNMDVNTPYEFLIYTADQERKTKMTHGKTARMAIQQGSETLGTICAKVGGEEGLHEYIYTTVFGEVFDADQDGAIIAFRDKMKRRIIMPSMLIDDGIQKSTARQPKLFMLFGRVEEALGTFDLFQDSADDMMHFMRVWRTQERTRLSPEAREAQEELSIIHQGLLARAEKQREKRQRRKLLDLSAFNRLVPPV